MHFNFSYNSLVNLYTKHYKTILKKKPLTAVKVTFKAI